MQGLSYLHEGVPLGLLDLICITLSETQDHTTLSKQRYRGSVVC
jgi:hypothetical protein